MLHGQDCYQYYTLFTSAYGEHPSMTMLGLKQVIETGASSLLLRSSREA